jgi:hypothetical protein
VNLGELRRSQLVFSPVIDLQFIGDFEELEQKENALRSGPIEPR